MKKLIIAFALAVAAYGQPRQPTTQFTILNNVAGVIPIGVTAIPPSYMIGQFTHTLNIILSNNGAACNFNQAIIGLDGSFDNSKWIALGAPITSVTGTPGVTGQTTGFTVLYGFYPFLRVNVKRAFGTNCRTTLSYVGSVNPTAFSTSLPENGDQYLTAWINNSDVSSITPIAVTTGLGSKISILGLRIANNDTTNATIYTISLFNKGTGGCAVGGSGTTEALFTYRVLAGESQTISLGSGIGFFNAPTVAGSGSASSLDTYDPVAGFYVICIQGTNASLTTVNMVYKSY